MSGFWKALIILSLVSLYIQDAARGEVEVGWDDRLIGWTTFAITVLVAWLVGKYLWKDDEDE
jgi:hypothetical protein